MSGGTEYWLHKSHGPNKAIVDIDDNDSNLNNYITKNGIRNDKLSCGYANVPKYQLSPYKGIYTKEGNHWHVCY